MGLNRRIVLGVGASYIGRALQIVLNLALLPLMFRHLSEEVIGMWYLLGNATLFLGLLDFGFGPTLTRRIAFAKGISGAHTEVELTAESREILGELMCTGKIIYRYLALAVLLTAGAAGLAMLKAMTITDLSTRQVFGAWALFSLSYAINAWGGLWPALLGGLGYVGSATLIGILVQVVAVIIKITVVMTGGGLVGLAVVECVAAIANRQIMLLYLRWKEPSVFTIPGHWSRAEFRSLLNPASKLWVTSLGGFLLLYTDQFFIGYFLGIKEIANYRATYAVISNLYTMALTFSFVSMPFYSQLWRAGHLATLHNVLFRNLTIGLGIMVSGILAVSLSSPELFNLWLGPDHFVGFAILLVFSTMLFLEVQHVIFSSAARSTEDEVYAPWALGAGLLNLLLTWILVQRIGLLGVALGTMLAQMATNNWYAVVHPLSRLQLRFSTYAERVLLPLAILAIASAVPLMIVLRLTPVLPWNDLLRVMLVFAWCGGVFAVYLWRSAITSGERLRLTLKLKSMLWQFRW